MSARILCVCLDENLNWPKVLYVLHIVVLQQQIHRLISCLHVSALLHLSHLNVNVLMSASVLLSVSISWWQVCTVLWL